MKKLYSGDENWYQLKDDIKLIYEMPEGDYRTQRVKEMRAYIRANYTGEYAQYLIDYELKYF